MLMRARYAKQGAETLTRQVASKVFFNAYSSAYSQFKRIILKLATAGHFQSQGANSRMPAVEIAYVFTSSAHYFHFGFSSLKGSICLWKSITYVEVEGQRMLGNGVRGIQQKGQRYAKDIFARHHFYTVPSSHV